MRLLSITSLGFLLSNVAAAPYDPFPLSDSFPKPNAEQLRKIEILAGGTLPNGPLPKVLTDTAKTTLQLIALQEVFEVAYFTDLLYNVTHSVPGYALTGVHRAYALESLTAIQNQEKLHYLGANGILASAGREQMQPCKYTFPVNDYLSAIALAQTFTDVVLGVIPQAQFIFGADGGDELPLINLLGSILGQEAQQDGWFRVQQKKIPSAAPFLTTEGPSFAFSLLQGLIVPGSCPNIDLVSKVIPTFGKLNVVNELFAASSQGKFSVTGTVTSADNSLVYLSGQNLPVTVPITNVQESNGVTTFEAAFPFDSGFAKGLTIAAVVKGTDKLSSASEVAAKTLFGPGIIEIH